MSTVMTSQDSQETRRRQRMPLRWSDMQTSGAVRPAGVAADAPVEWVVAMPAK